MKAKMCRLARSSCRIKFFKLKLKYLKNGVKNITSIIDVDKKRNLGVQEPIPKFDLIPVQRRPSFGIRKTQQMELKIQCMRSFRIKIFKRKRKLIIIRATERFKLNREIDICAMTNGVETIAHNANDKGLSVKIGEKNPIILDPMTSFAGPDQIETAEDIIKEKQPDSDMNFVPCEPLKQISESNDFKVVHVSEETNVNQIQCDLSEVEQINALYDNTFKGELLPKHEIPDQTPSVLSDRVLQPYQQSKEIENFDCIEAHEANISLQCPPKKANCCPILTEDENQFLENMGGDEITVNTQTNSFMNEESHNSNVKRNSLNLAQKSSICATANIVDSFIANASTLEEIAPREITQCDAIRESQANKDLKNPIAHKGISSPNKEHDPNAIIVHPSTFKAILPPGFQNHERCNIDFPIKKSDTPNNTETYQNICEIDAHNPQVNNTCAISVNHFVEVEINNETTAPLQPDINIYAHNGGLKVLDFDSQPQSQSSALNKQLAPPCDDNNISIDKVELSVSVNACSDFNKDDYELLKLDITNGIKFGGDLTRSVNACNELSKDNDETNKSRLYLNKGSSAYGCFADINEDEILEAKVVDNSESDNSFIDGICIKRRKKNGEEIETDNPNQLDLFNCASHLHSNPVDFTKENSEISNQDCAAVNGGEEIKIQTDLLDHISAEYVNTTMNHQLSSTSNIQNSENDISLQQQTDIFNTSMFVNSTIDTQCRNSLTRTINSSPFINGPLYAKCCSTDSVNPHTITSIAFEDPSKSLSEIKESPEAVASNFSVYDLSHCSVKDAIYVDDRNSSQKNNSDCCTEDVFLADEKCKALTNCKDDPNKENFVLEVDTDLSKAVNENSSKRPKLYCQESFVTETIFYEGALQAPVKGINELQNNLSNVQDNLLTINGTFITDMNLKHYDVSILIDKEGSLDENKSIKENTNKKVITTVDPANERNIMKDNTPNHYYSIMEELMGHVCSSSEHIKTLNCIITQLQEYNVQMASLFKNLFALIQSKTESFQKEKLIIADEIRKEDLRFLKDFCNKIKGSLSLITTDSISSAFKSLLGDISILNNEILQMKKDFNTEHAILIESKNNEKMLKARADMLEENVNYLSKQIENLKFTNFSLCTTLNNVTVDLTEVKKAMDSLEAEKTHLSLLVEQLKNIKKIEFNESHSDLTEIKIKLGRLRELIDSEKFLEFKDSLVALATEALSKKDLEIELNNKNLDELKADLQEIKIENTELSNSRNILMDANKELTEEIKIKESYNLELEKSIDELMKSNKFYEDQLINSDNDVKKLKEAKMKMSIDFTLELDKMRKGFIKENGLLKLRIKELESSKQIKEE